MEKKESGILKVENLSVKLGNNLVLKDVNLEVEDGEMMGIVGISGVGKTTLLNSIIGFYPVLKGTISYYSSVRKEYVSVLNLDECKSLFGFSAQNPSFYPEISVLENLRYFASLYGMPEDVKEQNIMWALKLVQLEDHGKVRAKNLSGGMQKRLDIACAIAHKPRILMLDEPTSDMDPLLRIQMWDLMENINHTGTTVIVSSHFLSELEHTCDRIALLHDKKAVYIGTPRNFRGLYSNVKEIHVSTKDGRYDLILKKVKSIPFLEVKHIYKRKGRIVLHSSDSEKNIKNAISDALSKEANVSDVEIRNPSFDMLFKLFVKK